MQHKQKEQAKPAQKEVKKANMQARPNKQKENQKKVSFVLAFLLVFIVFAAIAVPVSYIPFLNKIAQSFGLPTAITRQLTLLDLSLNSLGIETDAMKEAFKQDDITAGPMNPLLYSRFEPEMSHLINARETYFYEFERTHRRPDEISGIYKDGKEVNTPNLKQGQVAGVRSLPKEAAISDDTYPGAVNVGVNGAAGRGTRGGVSSDGSGNSAGGVGGVSGANSSGENAVNGVDETSSSKSRNGLDNGGDRGSSFGSRYSRGASYSVEGDLSASASSNGRKNRKNYERDEDGNPVAIPGFVSSVYANNQTQKGTKNKDGEPVDLNNSGMIRPVVKGTSFSVRRQDTPVEQFLGSSEFASTLNGLHSFGGYGTLGFYIADDLPENTGRGTFQKFGVSGEDAINSYFYSYVASGRKYSESSKYLAEVAFSGEKAPNEEILIAHGQNKPKHPQLPEGASPLTIMDQVQRRMRECNQAERNYWVATQADRTEYEQKIEHLKAISRNEQPITEGSVTKGAPGYCPDNMSVLWSLVHYTVESPLPSVRNDWNATIERLKELCENLQAAERTYANACHLTYTPNSDPHLDTCNSIKALKVKGEDYTPTAGELWDHFILGQGWRAYRGCLNEVKWVDTSLSPSFTDCNSSTTCIDAMDTIFNNIEDNIKVEPDGNFLGDI